MGKSIVTPNHVYTKLGNGTIRDLTLDTNTVYTHPVNKVCNYNYVHPSTKQCNYSYTHPSTRQCSKSDDAITSVQTLSIGNYYTNLNVSEGSYIVACKVNDSGDMSYVSIGPDGNGNVAVYSNNCSSGCDVNTFAFFMNVSKLNAWNYDITVLNYESNDLKVCSPNSCNPVYIRARADGTARVLKLI